MINKWVKLIVERRWRLDTDDDKEVDNNTDNGVTQIDQEFMEHGCPCELFSSKTSTCNQTNFKYR